MYSTPYGLHYANTPVHSATTPVPEDDPHSNHNHRKDYGSEIECYRMEKEFKQMRQELDDLKRDNFDLKHKVNDMNDVVKAKNNLIDEQKNQLYKNLKEYKQKISGLEKERSDSLVNLQKHNEEQTKQLYEKHTLISMQRTRINALIESVKKHESTNKLLTTEKTNLNKTIIQNKKEIEDLTKEIEEWREKVNVREGQVDKYKDKYESCRSHNQKIRKELKEMKDNNNCEELKKEKQRLTKDIQSLKQQRKYFENRYNYHKQKALASSHTAIRTHGLYANCLRENHEKNKNIRKEILKEFRETINDKLDILEENFDQKTTENLAQTVTNVGEGMEEIHKKQRLMEEKTADGRVHCGSCEKIFGSLGDLKHHMTVTHKMNTTDLSLNEPEIIQID